MIEIKKLPKSEIEISGEMPAEEFSKFWPKAVNELSKDVKLPGFRPGHIPEKILIEKMGEGAILEKAGEMALQDFYPKIIVEKKLELLGPPRASITKISKGGVLGYKFQAAVFPEMKLPENFKEIAKKVFEEKEEVKVEEREVDDSIEYIKKIKEKNLDNKDLPEINDELRKTVRKNLQTEKEWKMKEKKRLEALDEILKKMEIEIPDILLESEKQKMLFGLKNNIIQSGLKWEDYLKHIKKEEKDILDGLKEDALRRVKYGLLLDCLSKELGINATDEEIEKEINKMPQQQKEIDRNQLKSYIYGIIRNKKIFESLC